MLVFRGVHCLVGWNIHKNMYSILRLLRVPKVFGGWSFTACQVVGGICVKLINSFWPRMWCGIHAWLHVMHVMPHTCHVQPVQLIWLISQNISEMYRIQLTNSPLFVCFLLFLSSKNNTSVKAPPQLRNHPGRHPKYFHTHLQRSFSSRSSGRRKSLMKRLNAGITWKSLSRWTTQRLLRRGHSPVPVPVPCRRGWSPTSRFDWVPIPLGLRGSNKGRGAIARNPKPSKGYHLMNWTLDLE